MAAYRLSRKAATDLDGIHEYTIANFGLAQARDYLNGATVYYTVSSLPMKESR